MDYVEKAFHIAKAAHEGQYDKGSRPYIEHPMHVAENVKSDAAKAVAYLHDVIEDTKGQPNEITADDLREAGIPEEVVIAVVAMTHEEGEDYFDYVRRLKENSIAREVKLADLSHNMDRSRIPDFSENDEKRLAKYEKAKKILLEE